VIPVTLVPEVHARFSEHEPGTMSTPLRRRTDIDASALPPLRALIAEDDENYAAYLGVLMRRFGFEVTVTGNGTTALAAAKEAPFDVAVIDCEMPGMNGLELIAALRANQRCADMYALMVTGHTDLETKVAALRLGYDDFITKANTGETEMIAKLGAARRLVQRQRRLDVAVRELYGLATRDELTGLFNRRHFHAEAERMLGEGQNLTLALFDLNDFKGVNDSHGHLAGDQILRDVGALFLRSTRADDLIARYGGDEFVLVATHETVEEMAALAARLIMEIGKLRWTFDGENVAVGASAGVTSSTMFEKPTLGQLVAACDRDLYKNKRASTSGQRPGEARAAALP
jgi:two-component system chemotaxis response regulator CheY